MFIGAHEAEYMFVTTLLKIEQHLLAQGRCPYKLFRKRQGNSRSSTRRNPTHGGSMAASLPPTVDAMELSLPYLISMRD